MKRYRNAFIALALLSAQIANATPYQLQYGGRMTLTNGQPITGPVNLSVAFYHVQSGGIIVSNQVFNAVSLTDGVFSIAITLTEAEFEVAFSSAESWIEITDVTHGKVYPRQRYSAVPYAFKIPVDNSTLTYKTNGQLTVTGLNGAALPTSTPASGQVLKWNGSAWTWAADETTAAGSVNSSSVQDGSLGNVDIAPTAAIAGSKIVPNFGAQNITTTGIISGDGSGLTNLPTGALGTSIESAEITDGTITNSDLAGAIDQSKISGLAASFTAKEDAFAAGTSAQYLRGDKSWATLDTNAIPENTNLYFTQTRARAALSATAPVVYNSASGVISMGAATSVSNGYLSSGDWIAFNAKQAPITSASVLDTGTVTTALQNGVQLKPFGTATGESGELRFSELVANGSNYIGFKAPDALAANRIWTLPAADGASGQLLQTNGSGALSWITPSAAAPVSSVNGSTGVVVLTSDNIAEGSTNKYFSATAAKNAAVADTI
ncbi:MAG: hypothetical protein EOP10_03505, partial [Proteobacteria bacterium]